MVKIDKDFEHIPASLLAEPPKIDATVRTKLAEDQHDKCCYCEDSEIKGTVEHFCPKSEFPEFEFSWENLLWACGDCNNLKGSKFDKNTPIVNPLKNIPANILAFEVNGTIKSDNANMLKSIETCGLSRKNLNDKRKGIYDDWIRNLTFIKTIGSKSDVIEYFVKHIVAPTKENKKLSFIAFRKYIIEKHLKKVLLT